MLKQLFSFLILNALCLVLQWWRPGPLPWVALDALLLMGLLGVIRAGVWRRRIAWALGVGYVALALFVAADGVMRLALGRPLNLYLDSALPGKVVDLAVTNLGYVWALGFAAVLVLSVLVLAWLVRTLLLYAGRQVSVRQAKAMTALALVGLALLPVRAIPVTVSGAEVLATQVERIMDAQAQTEAFSRQLNAVESTGSRGPVVAMDRLAGDDVLIGFIESYGVSALGDPRYRPVLDPRLDAMEQALSTAGLSVVSGRLRSPVQGGQSWLAHATVLSGLWVDSAMAYDVMLSSGYATLIDDFRQTGHDTVAVMPAITRAWPEGRQLGYRHIYDAQRIDYAGPALNWVTMPDQYTWSWFQRQVRDASATPIFAELALISSHAPWVPILPVLPDWQAIGDGQVFAPWKGAGEAPAELWRDPERVRQHYIRAIDYALTVATDYAIRHVDNHTLLILLGDHQPAPLVTGEGASRDVPVHIIARDPDLLAPFIGPAGLPGFRPGVRPELDRPGPRMDQLRSFLHIHFSTVSPVASR